MGAPYDSVSVSSYNANPPPDDGSENTANQITWAKIKTKLADTLKTAIESINTNIGTAFGKVVGGAGVVSTAISYGAGASDQGKLIIVTGSGETVTTPDATSVESPFVFRILNLSSGSITLDGYDSQTVDGAASTTIPAGNGCMVSTDGSNWFTDGQNFTRSFPAPGAFKNLVIKVASNTTVTVTADYVTTTDGVSYQTTAVSSTVNLGTTGADALDTGTIATSTWYAIWVIAKADGTTKCLASTSATAPTMPTDYTFKARIGWVRTVAASATLFGTWQFGRKAQYKVGLAQTANLREIISGTSGDISAPTWTAASVSTFVPTTASVISLVLRGYISASGAGVVMAAPNGSYGNATSSTNPPPLLYNLSASGGLGMNISGALTLESTNVYYACNIGTGGGLFCAGWEDNI